MDIDFQIFYVLLVDLDGDLEIHRSCWKILGGPIIFIFALLVSSAPGV